MCGLYLSIYFYLYISIYIFVPALNIIYFIATEYIKVLNVSICQ